MKTLLLYLIKYAIAGGELPRGILDNVSPDELIELAKKYDLSAPVVYALEKQGVTSKALFKEKALAVYRAETLGYTARLVCELFEKAEIPHMLLKGEHIGTLYPEKWIRPSCDVDVYVDAADLKRASEALASGGFVKFREGTHDVGFTSPNGCHTELHFILIEEAWLKGADEIFSDIWNKSIKESGFRYRMDKDMLRFYHLAHMAKHVKNGGCGIRPFVDIWLIDRSSSYSTELYEKSGLLKFNETVCDLSEVWLSDGEHTPVTRALEKYVFSGGAYGTVKNNVVIQRKNAGNRFNYILSRLFMPYSQLSKKYPSLSGKPLLFPLYTLRRWFSAFKRQTSRRVNGELAITNKRIDTLSRLFEELGL